MMVSDGISALTVIFGGGSGRKTTKKRKGGKEGLLYTLLGTNISPEKSILKMIFLFPRWDMLISWRVTLILAILLVTFLGW